MKLFPKVTKDFSEYRKLSGSSLQKPSVTAKGYYYNGVIWVKHLDPLTLGHEFTHYMLNSVGNTSFLTRRLFDLIDFIQDSFYHYLRYEKCRDLETKHIIMKGIHEIIEDIKIWITCK
jgi:hypothetical protein